MMSSDVVEPPFSPRGCDAYAREDSVVGVSVGGRVHQHLEVRIAACPDYVWAVLVDVARWPEWSPSLREVEAFDGGPLVVGGGIRIRQRHLPDRQWRVAELRRHRGFVWRGDGVGSAATLRVRMARAEGGGTDLVVDLDRSGWVGAVMGRMTGGTSAAHLDELVTGLRQRCEAGQCAPSPTRSAP